MWVFVAPCAPGDWVGDWYWSFGRVSGVYSPRAKWVRMLGLLQDRVAVREWDLARAAFGVKCGFLKREWGNIFLFFGRRGVRGETCGVG